MSAINVNRFLRDVLTPGLPDGVNLVTRKPADLLARLPLVFARHTTGTDVHPRWAAYASVTVDSYTSLEDDPFDLAKSVHDRLLDVQERQTVFPDGWVSHLEVLLPPWDNADPLEATVVNRSTAEYRLLIRSPQ